MVWYGMVWYGIVQYSIVQYSIVYAAWAPCLDDMVARTGDAILRGVDMQLPRENGKGNVSNAPKGNGLWAKGS